MAGAGRKYRLFSEGLSKEPAHQYRNRFQKLFGADDRESTVDESKCGLLA